MSDRDLNINIRTTADTSGADQTTEAIDRTGKPPKKPAEARTPSTR